MDEMERNEENEGKLSRQAATIKIETQTQLTKKVQNERKK